jgi:hypothetical protein
LHSSRYTDIVVLANLVVFSHHFNFIVSVKKHPWWLADVKVCVHEAGLYLIAKRAYRMLLVLLVLSSDMTLVNTWLQAVVVSIDPRRVYLNDPSDVEFKSIKLTNPGKENFLVLIIFTALRSAN